MFSNSLKQFEKPLKVLIAVVGIVALMLEVGMITWKIVGLHNLKPSLQDVYFTEFGDGTSIYKYDVARGKTVTVAVLKEGRYSDCMINRTENYIIGEFYNYETETRVLLRYNLSDDTVEEITGEEAEVMEERIKKAEDKLPERSDLPEEVRKIVSNKFISWSVDGKTAAFSDTNQEKIYLYHADAETLECILEANRWAQTFGGDPGLDSSGRYVFYENNFIYLFDTADVKIMICDTQTRMRKKIFVRRYTQNIFEFVQDLNF